MSTKALIIIIGTGFFLMAMMGGGFLLMWQQMNSALMQVQSQNNSDKAVGKAATGQEQTIGPIYKMDTLIVNLADRGGKRYLRITMELELSTPEVVEEIQTRMPQLRDTLLMILPSKKYEDISTTEGKTALRDELIGKMNAILKTGQIVTIYFTEFVVQ